MPGHFVRRIIVRNGLNFIQKREVNMRPLSLILKLCLFIISILLFSCNDDDSIIYFNSFENSSDLRGWDGLDKSSLADDVPNIFGGKKSVLISGGCVYPTSKYTISPRGDDAFIRVECFGKNLSFGGQIVSRRRIRH